MKLSNQRYAFHALLGKRFFHGANMRLQLVAALSVRPQEHHAWWRVGTASMRRKVDNGLEGVDSLLKSSQPTEGLETWAQSTAV